MMRLAAMADVMRPRRAGRRRDVEGPVQTAILMMIASDFEADVYSTLNGARLTPKVRAKMVSEGLKAGIPDLYVVWDGGDGWLEVKKPGYTPSDVSPGQKAFISRQRENGRNAAVVSSPESASSTLSLWGCPTKAAA